MLKSDQQCLKYNCVMRSVYYTNYEIVDIILFLVLPLLYAYRYLMRSILNIQSLILFCIFTFSTCNDESNFVNLNFSLLFVPASMLVYQMIFSIQTKDKLS